MDINRRTLLASGTTLAGLSVLTGETMAQGAKKAEVPKGGVVLTAMVKAKQGQEDAVKEAAPRPGRADAEGTRLPVLQPAPVEVRPDDVHVLRAVEEQGSPGRPREDSSHEGAGGKLKDRTDKGGGVVVYELLE